MTCARMRVRVGPGLNRLTRTGGRGGFLRIGSRQRVERGLRHRIGAAIGAGMGGGARCDEHGAAGVGALEQGIHGADEMPVGGDVDRHHLIPVLRLDVIERRALARDAALPISTSSRW